MTHFWSDSHQDRPYSTMNSELRSIRPTPTKRGNSAIISSPEYETAFDRVSEEHHDRVSEYQRISGTDRPESSPIKRQRPSPSSSNSSSTSSKAAHRRNSKASGKSHNSTANKLKMAELLSIKRELTVIKVQIDELLDCVDKMDRQRKDCTDCPVGRELGVASPHRGSVSSLDRDSPEPGEASEEEPVYYQHYYTHSYSHRIPEHSSDPEDGL